MSINKALITVEESDTILASYDDWLSLTDEAKTNHIASASTYVQLNWSCTSVDWDDESTITDEIKEATAYYALADSKGNLYPSVDETIDPVGGTIIETTDKVGSLQSTIKYDPNGAQDAADSLTYPDSLMGYGCQSSSRGGSVKAIRN